MALINMHLFKLTAQITHGDSLMMETRKIWRTCKGLVVEVNIEEEKQRIKEVKEKDKSSIEIQKKYFQPSFLDKIAI